MTRQHFFSPLNMLGVLDLFLLGLSLLHKSQLTSDTAQVSSELYMYSTNWSVPDSEVSRIKRPATMLATWPDQRNGRLIVMWWKRWELIRWKPSLTPCLENFSGILSVVLAQKALKPGKNWACRRIYLLKVVLWSNFYPLIFLSVSCRVPWKNENILYHL